MRLLFVVDPPETFKTYKDSTYAMMMEAAARGHTLHTCLQEDLLLAAGLVHAHASRLTLTGEKPGWFTLAPSVREVLTAFDAVIMRKDPPFDMEYFYSTHLLERAVHQGAKVFNDPAAIRNHSEKLSIAEFPQFTAPTLATRRADELRAFVAEHGQAVFKPLDGMGGTGIFRVGQGEPNLSVIIEMLGRDGHETIMAQKYLPAIADGDKRILLIAGKPVPHCLARIPKAGETRGNLAAGGTGVARELTARDREIAEFLGPILWGRGLLLVGLDVIGDNLTEINVTSPTCFQEITQQTGCNVAGLFIDAVEAAAAK
ncbi:MAG TPA: glutathione synthase [Burkholderiales bacterium]|jgi:glutathione synthase|nr:glutathione synthase [Burkholderiales bacterium]